MQLYMKEKVWSFADRFTVKDANGFDRWHVEGEVFSLGKKLHILDANGVEVAMLRQKVMSFLPRFFIEINGREVGAVVKDFTLLTPHYHVEGLPLTLEGDFWAHDYRLLDEGRPVMALSREWFSWGDSYRLDIGDGADELIGLCVALAVDCVIEQERQH